VGPTYTPPEVTEAPVNIILLGPIVAPLGIVEDERTKLWSFILNCIVFEALSKTTWGSKFDPLP
jgi:hypothetical protein